VCRCLLALSFAVAAVLALAFSMYLLRSPAAAAAPVETVTVTLSPSRIVADGVSSSTATATVSLAGAPLVGQTVVFSSSDGGIRFGPTIDNLNGTYTAMLTSSRVAGSATVTATTSSGASQLSGQTTLVETPGPASSMTLSIAPPSISANGSSSATATATLADGNGNPIPTDAVTFSSSDPGEQIVGTANNGGGTYSALIRSSTTPGQVVITATDTNANRIARSQLTQTAAQAPGSPNTSGPGRSSGAGSMLPFVTMQWSFRYTSAYTEVLSLVVDGAPAVAAVQVACHGSGCPFTRDLIVIGQTRRCRLREKHACRGDGTIELAPDFRRHRLSAGTRLTVAITRPTWIGKYYVFVVRKRRAPRVRVTCLAPGQTQPSGVC